jgi:hypothetical protein
MSDVCDIEKAMLLVKCIYDTSNRLVVLKELLNQFCPEILKNKSI